MSQPFSKLRFAPQTSHSLNLTHKNILITLIPKFVLTLMQISSKISISSKITLLALDFYKILFYYPFQYLFSQNLICQQYTTISYS